MTSKQPSAEQIIANLNKADVELARGKTTDDVCRLLGIHKRTYERWRGQYAAVMTIHRLRQLGRLERENTRLKRVVSRQASSINLLKVLTS